MRSLTVKEIIERLQTKNPDAPVVLFTNGDVTAKPILQIDDVPIKGNSVPGVLLS